MKIATCPHCGVHVAISRDGNCPSCRGSFADVPEPEDFFSDNPFESPVDIVMSTTVAQETTIVGMTAAEKVFSAIIIAFAAWFLMSILVFFLLLIPGSDDPGFFYFMISVLSVYALTLATTVTINLYYRSLLTIPTIVQCVTLSITVYFIPLAIWGGILLYRRLKRAKGSG